MSKKEEILEAASLAFNRLSPEEKKIRSQSMQGLMKNEMKRRNRAARKKRLMKIIFFWKKAS
jgi:hypothetical protein